MHSIPSYICTMPVHRNAWKANGTVTVAMVRLSLSAFPGEHGGVRRWCWNLEEGGVRIQTPTGHELEEVCEWVFAVNVAAIG